METIEIQTNKSKLFIILILNILFVVMGIVVLFSPEIKVPFIESRGLAIVASALCILIFGFLTKLTFQKTQDKKPGIIIDTYGITDHYNGMSTIRIPWKDIEAIKPTTAYLQKHLIIMVKNPEKYINEGKNNFEIKARRSNYDNYGTPFCMTTSTLKMEFNELYKTLNERLNQKTRDYATNK